MNEPSERPGCLGMLLQALGLLPPAPFRYSAKPLLSPAERSFLGVLDRVVSSDMRVLSKVRLADLLKVSERGSRWQSAFNKIAMRHADFVVCDAADFSVLFVVELDDSSHSSAKSKKSDSVKDQAFTSSGIRLVRVKAKKSYSIAELSALLFPSPPALPNSGEPG